MITAKRRVPGYLFSLFLGILVCCLCMNIPFQHASISHAQLVADQHAHLHADLPKGCVDDGNTDYPGAIDCMLDPHTYDCKQVAKNAACTYETAHRPADYAVNFLEIHDMEGTVAAGINTLRNVKNGVSIHYIVDTDGTVYQLLPDEAIGYHAGNYWYNQRAIGIEHAGYAADGYQWYHAAQYEASAKLAAYLINKFHIPFDRAHVLDHGQTPAPTVALMPNHVDPGPFWMWDYYFSLIIKQGVTPVDTASDEHIVSLHPANGDDPFDVNGAESKGNINFFTLYSNASTTSSIIPHAGAMTMLNETYNVETGVSYAYLAAKPDEAGSGATMYQIWYGEAVHMHDQKPSYFESARLAWLAAPPQSAYRGNGRLITFKSGVAGGLKVYGCPAKESTYQIGDMPENAIFVSEFSLFDSKTNSLWYEINYNHRQAWVPASEVAS
ncbi:MAG TPA: peptidoglycan recognition family protein [Dictyobacter sp.]|nr:peptidoglycan recognition family protein [Dictyobacter sp.]